MRRPTIINAPTPRSFWSYQAPEPPHYSTLPAGLFSGTRDQWESLTPGMRREIVRDHERRMRLGVDSTV